MQRILVLVYGSLAYGVGMASLVYLAAWLGNFVPRSIDSAPVTSFVPALLANITLFALFGLQHSVMARPKFKEWWTQFVPKPIERSTYVLFSGVAMFLVMAFWQPVGISIWSFENPVGRALLYGLYGCGWAILVGSTFLINHFDLFGLRQVWLYFRGREYTQLNFGTPGCYRIVRHPLYVGWITLAWATPTMSLAHFGFALATTVYILIAIPFEERDLVAFHGESYADYRRRTPMLIPGIGLLRGSQQSSMLEQAQPPSVSR